MGAERIGHDFKLIFRTDVTRCDESPIERLADLLERVEIETGFEREAAVRSPIRPVDRTPGKHSDGHVLVARDVLDPP